LENQIDAFEAEMEGLSVKKGKSRPPRLVRHFAALIFFVILKMKLGPFLTITRCTFDGKAGVPLTHNVVFRNDTLK
jgi:hypothetical protein